MEFRLSETDRKHYGLTDEWMYYEVDRFTNREADLIEPKQPDGPGMKPTEWLEALQGEIVEDKGVPRIDEKTGEPIKAPSARTVDVMIWLGVRRAGHPIAWPDWEYDRVGILVRRDVEPTVAGLGKDEPAVESSPG